MAGPTRILIAGIGNIFFGDDAFGCEVAQRLAGKEWPEGIELRDFGIRGIDLAYALLEPRDFVILVDAMPRGGTPGTLYLLEPDIPEPGDPAAEGESLWNAHTMHPEKVLRLAQSLGADLKRILLIGCEPAPFDPENDICTGLSGPVEATVSAAARITEMIVRQLAEGNQSVLDEWDQVLLDSKIAGAPAIRLEEETS